MSEDGSIVDDVSIEIKNLETNEVEVVKVNKGKYVASLALSKDDNVLITIKKKVLTFLQNSLVLKTQVSIHLQV